jgi:FKBP-type peptidyl-prolyl cis-trans isomerase FklB
LKYRLTAVALITLNASGALYAEQPLDLEDETTRINYSLGYQIGGDFKRQNVEMNAEAVVQGIRDALSGAEPKLSAAQMRTTLMELKRKVVAEQKQRSAKQELEILAEGKRFIEENAKQPGVITTASGLQYKIIEEGSGRKPGPTDQVTVHYRGKLIEGREFDSSHKRGKPATFRLNGVIKGWTEGLQLMKEGGKAQLFIPPELAYGRRGPLAHQTLIFDVELIAAGDPSANPASTADKTATKEAAGDKR